MKHDIKRIKWPHTPALANAKDWKNSVRVVKALCRECVVTQWLEGKPGRDTYELVPYHYEADGLKIEFLPHWAAVSIGGEDFFNITGPKSLKQAVALRRAYLEDRKQFNDKETPEND